MRVVGSGALLVSSLAGAYLWSWPIGVIAVAVVATAGLRWRGRRTTATSFVDAPAFRVPAGWYPDPTTAGRQRWFDGMTWTDDAMGEAPTA
jgi:hypothetical protein